VAGVVHHLEALQEVGHLHRARWSRVVSDATRWPADLVVVGRASAGVDVSAVMAGLKDDPATDGIPVLHALPPEVECTECRADVCLTGGWAPRQLARVAHVLMDLRRARFEVESAGPGGRRPLGQAERLETLGRLTGGIVHDFNNLLFVMTGQIDLARRLLAADHPALARLTPAFQAAEHAAALTRQLLAFGRGSSAHPRLVDMNAVVAQLDRMLQRLIGEDVEIQIRAGTALGWVRADVAQMEHLLLNLALNARDAMPRGGRLTIETRDVDIADRGLAAPVSPGRYVMLAVSDDGVGMDAETKGRIFEPFFTTKPEGRGSGLGLSTVRGIVDDAGGTILVESEPGLGTTFRIFLPCVDEQGEPSGLDAVSARLPRGGETVLVAEDSEPVREVTRELLAALGYSVLTASRGEEALAVARAHDGPIHLLLTDVVMPDLRGGSLAEQLVAERPEARVLYMSGYGDGVARTADGPGEHDLILRKPFDQDHLARAVRDALDRARTGGSDG
jgi:signal transduction histidine kinase/ActR/RegA family two-component response regulator